MADLQPFLGPLVASAGANASLVADAAFCWSYEKQLKPRSHSQPIPIHIGNLVPRHCSFARCAGAFGLPRFPLPCKR